MSKENRRLSLRAFAPLAVLALSLLISASVHAGEVKKIAVLVPEQGTDFGWNQQGVDAAREVAEKYGLEFLPAEGLGYGDVRPTLRELAALDVGGGWCYQHHRESVGWALLGFWFR